MCACVCVCVCAVIISYEGKRVRKGCERGVVGFQKGIDSFMTLSYEVLQRQGNMHIRNKYDYDSQGVGRCWCEKLV